MMMRVRRRILESRLDVQMQARAQVGLGERLRNVDAKSHDGDSPAKADADRVLERVAQLVHRVPGIREHGNTEIALQITLQLHAEDDQVTATGLVAFRVDGRQRVEREATHAEITTGEEAPRSRKLGEICHRAQSQLAAQQQVPARVEIEHVFVLKAELQKVRVRAERARRACQLRVETTPERQWL